MFYVMHEFNQRNWSLQPYPHIGARCDGKRYELRLCEKCFFYALAIIKRKHLGEQIFDENVDPIDARWVWAEVKLIVILSFCDDYPVILEFSYTEKLYRNRICPD